MNKLYFRALRSSIYGFLAMATLAFCARGDARLLAGARLYGRLRGRVGRHHGVSRDERSEASGAADERGANGGKGAGSKDHHGCRAAGIYRALGCSGIGPSLPVVSRPSVGLHARRPLGRPWIFVSVLRDSREYLCCFHDPSSQGQTVISTGPSAVVRHPMYAGVLPLLMGTPLALGSWWGRARSSSFMPALLWRLLDEERFLHRNLPGYTDYTRKVRYRLVPFVW